MSTKPFVVAICIGIINVMLDRGAAAENAGEYIDKNAPMAIAFDDSPAARLRSDLQRVLNDIAQKRSAILSGGLMPVRQRMVVAAGAGTVQQDNGPANASINQLLRKLQEALDGLSGADAAPDSLIQQLVVAREQMEQLAARIRRLDADRSTLAEAASDAAQQAGQMQVRLAEREAELDAATLAVRQVENRLDQERRRAAALDSESEAKSRALADARSSLQAKSAEAAVLARQAEEARRDAAAQVASLSELRDVAERSRRRAEAELARSREEARTMLARQDTLTAQLKQRDALVADMQSTEGRIADVLRSALEDIESARRNRADAVSETESQIAAESARRLQILEAVGELPAGSAPVPAPAETSRAAPPQLRLELIASLPFALGQREVGAADDKRIRELCRQIGARRLTSLRVVGHTDRSGDAMTNYTLGFRRAQSVRDALARCLDPGVDIVVMSAGESEPVARRKAAERAEASRRVEVLAPRR